MLAVILKILSILGIILLILLCVIVCILFLVLFMPIVYKLDAEKNDTEIKANFRARWLFGFLRTKYIYPEPGRVIVKVLWFTVLESGKKSAQTDEKQTTSRPGADTEQIDTKVKITSTEQDASDATSTQQQDINIPSSDTVENTIAEDRSEGKSEENFEENPKPSFSEKLFAKYEKIKYTLKKIYDKIRHIFENISFYKKLLQDEQTKLLFSHVCKRFGKLLHHIRPRKLKANVIFGSESPDTTGYAYGVYSMFSPQLGKDVCITPDFTQKILTGTIKASGHITIFTLLVNVLAVLLDKRLRILIRRLKSHSAKQSKSVSNNMNAKMSA